MLTDDELARLPLDALADRLVSGPLQGTARRATSSRRRSAMTLAPQVDATILLTRGGRG